MGANLNSEFVLSQTQTLISRGKSDDVGFLCFDRLRCRPLLALGLMGCGGEGVNFGRMEGGYIINDKYN